jgi:hypothetical protein
MPSSSFKMKAYSPSNVENYQPDYTALYPKRMRSSLHFWVGIPDITLKQKQPVYMHHTTKVERVEDQLKKIILDGSCELHGLAATTWWWVISIDISDMVMMWRIKKTLPGNADTHV